MSIYKVLRCNACGYNRTDSRPAKTAPPCPRCGGAMHYGSDWWIGYTHRGKKVRHPIGPRKTDAEAAYHKAKTNIAEDRAHLNKVCKTPWKDARKKFLAWAGENVSDKGLAMFANSLKFLDRKFDGCTLDEINRYQVETEYVQLRREWGVTDADGIKIREVADSTINKDLTTIHRMLVKSVEWGLLESNPLAGMKKLSEPDPVERTFSDAEIAALLRECSAEGTGTGKGWASGRARNSNLRTIVLLALNTGMRKKNCLEVKRSDLNFDAREIRITVVKRKTARRLTIPMTPQLHDALKAHVRQQGIIGMDQYLFPSPRNPNKPMRVDANFGFENALARAGIKHGREECFHTLRHTFATHFLVQMTMGGMAIDGALELLREILAHSDLKTTMRYLHVAEKHKAAAMQNFSFNLG